MNIQVRVDAGTTLGDLSHNWNYLGYDEINYTYTPEGHELLAKLMDLQEKPYYLRAHHLLCTGNCHGVPKWGSTNAYLENDAGEPVYDWTFVDLVLDTILQYRCKPFVELGFMPQDLADPARYDAAGDTWTMKNYRDYGWACPPKDYQKWHDLIFQLVRHCAERYGVEEIRSWYWELWNEPDLDYYWKGSIQEFNKLYDYTVAAVKAVEPAARVGGPGTTNPMHGRRSGEFLNGFLDHCVNGVNAVTEQTGTPLDFLSFHVKGGGYRADPKHRKGTPPSVKQVLSLTQTGYEILSAYGGLKDLECVLSEIDPDGWAAGGAWDNANLNFRNTEYYPSFVAAAFDKVSAFARQNNWDLRLLTWAFLFVGERCFEGTRTLSTQGIDKAILNLFRMYSKMGDQQVSFASTGTKDPLHDADPCGRGEEPDVSGFATLSGKGLQVLIYNHHDDWDMSDEATVDLTITNLPFEAPAMIVSHFRIDHAHSNAYREWTEQGRPMYPTTEQRTAIKARESLELFEPSHTITVDGSAIRLNFTLPVHGISLVCVEPTTLVA